MIFWRAIRHLLFFSIVGKRINQKPIFNDIIFYLFREGTNIYTKYRLKIWGTHTDADPFKIIQVNPDKIENISGLDFGHSGEVRSGDWDQSTKKFIEENPVAQSIKLHFENSVPWRETPLYSVFQQELNTRGDAWGYKSMSDFEKRCEEIENLYNSIATDGYLTNREVYRQNRSRAHAKNNDGLHPNIHEVNVDIGRDGQLLWRRVGQNRLAIAKVLNLDKIPVRVAVRHTEWQQTRETIQSGDQQSADHPDLIDTLT
ncbi:hypothetical protein ACFQJ7_12145 [Halovenus rubra]|uniref:ParB-like nuclease domain-containing protein n=2 Tax=Halovenus rubra TaxID=869890 RepID=A0ABD5X6E1_9EURY|nr:hypothetical protein [Halovenus rubra]